MPTRLAAMIPFLALAACGDGPDGDRNSAPIRMPLAVASAATPAAVSSMVPAVPMAWTHAPAARAAWFGPPDAPAMLAVACEEGERGLPRLRMVRYVPAERGAKAILAIQGSKGILRLPVNAVKVGGDYAWRGLLDAADPRVEVLLGDNLKATVPGGGMLTMAAMGPAGAVVSECQARAASLQTLPKRASNPAVSPAAR